MPSSRSRHREKSSNEEQTTEPEILHQVGRAVLAYSLKHLGGQDSSTRDHDQDKPRTRSDSGKDGTHDTAHTSSRSRGSGSRSDSSDLHHIMSQLAVGIFGFGIRQYLHHRRQAKKNSAAAGSGKGGRKRSTNDNEEDARRPMDPELVAALESLTAELRGTSQSISTIANSAPSHKNCEVKSRLEAEADTIQGEIANIQMGINNMKNLHGGMERDAGVSQRRRRRERSTGTRRTL
ncbi:hypothetical protein B0H66DRAFT_450026, partial [Apodospora peruviana]